MTFFFAANQQSPSSNNDKIQEDKQYLRKRKCLIELPFAESAIINLQQRWIATTTTTTSIPNNTYTQSTTMTDDESHLLNPGARRQPAKHHIHSHSSTRPDHTSIWCFVFFITHWLSRWLAAEGKYLPIIVVKKWRDGRRRRRRPRTARDWVMRHLLGVRVRRCRRSRTTPSAIRRPIPDRLRATETSSAIGRQLVLVFQILEQKRKWILKVCLSSPPPSPKDAAVNLGWRKSVEVLFHDQNKQKYAAVIGFIQYCKGDDSKLNW